MIEILIFTPWNVKIEIHATGIAILYGYLLYISVNGSLGVQTSLFYSNFNHQVPPELNVNENNWLVMVNGRLQMVVFALVSAHAKFDF